MGFILSKGFTVKESRGMRSYLSRSYLSRRTLAFGAMTGVDGISLLRIDEATVGKGKVELG